MAVLRRHHRKPQTMQTLPARTRSASFQYNVHIILRGFTAIYAEVLYMLLAQRSLYT